MPIRVVLENTRVLLLGEASRVQDAVERILRRCADAARQSRGDAGPANEEEEEPRCNQTRQSCRELRGCADHVSVAHVREQRKFNREQEDLEVRGGVGLANQFGSIVSSHDPRPLSTSALRRHGDYSFGHLPPSATLPGKLLR
jgi:hypothetical protein